MSSLKPKILLTIPVAPEIFAKARADWPQYEWVAGDKERVLEQAADAEIICGSPRVDLVDAAPRLQWLQATSAGVEKVARSQSFWTRDFVLTTAAGMHDSCTEHAIALLLSLTRQVSLYARTGPAAGTQAGPQPYSPAIWDARKQNASPWVLHGKKLGILGLGAIGRSIARIAKAIGMTVLGVSFHGRSVPECDEVHPVARLAEVLPRLDVLIMILPAAPGTDGLMNAARIAKLPKHALLINVGRGNSIDEAALIEALREGRLAGAGLDVFAKEPLAADSPLYSLPNVVLTPHIGGNRPDYAERAFELFLANLARWTKGEPLTNVVERERGY